MPKEQVLTYDLVVIGSGSGLDVANACAAQGLKVAIVEQGEMGGTCLNRGCIPSKMYIHVADVVETINTAEKFGVKAKVLSIDYNAIVKRVRGTVDGESKGIEKAFKSIKNPKLFKGRAEFVGMKNLAVQTTQGRVVLRAAKFLIAAGARSTVPPIQGLEKTPYITSEGALKLKKLPKSMTVLGGGYIAAELAHFFGSLGVKITIVQRNELLIPREDREVAENFTRIFSQKYNVLTGWDVEGVSYSKKDGFTVSAKSKDGKSKKALKSEQLLVATGVTPNSDLLKVQNTGITPNKHGFIDSNEFLETSVKGIFVLGDVHGKFLFKHSANHEASYAVHNILHPASQVAVDYTAIPHAIFTSPQIAGVGLTQQELDEKKIAYAATNWPYIRSGMGDAIQDYEGFVKFYYEPSTRKILGCHILGTDASTLIHEVLVAMKAGKGTLDDLTKTVHIHPSLNEVVQRAAIHAN